MANAYDIVILAIYFGSFSLLVAYGMNRYFIAYLFLRYNNQKMQKPDSFDELPFVTVQLPIFNERYVVKRLIETTSRISYPKNRFEIQVLDDSSDETRIAAKKAVNDSAARGLNISYLRRKDREGFKAGALNYGLELAKGDLIAIFDADFLPPENFLSETVNYFTDSSVGMVQTRWDHINRDFSLFTGVQSLLLDGHFVIEHTARSRSGRFFNFNGTAGVWRKKALIDGGSWQYDTLTEDMDISYRVQLKGWKFIYLKDFPVPSELPVEMNAFKSQQHRWAKGSIQTAIKLLPTILRSPIPWKVKIESFFHLTNNSSYLFMLIVAVLMFPSMIIRFGHGWIDTMFFDMPLLFMATLSIVMFYSMAQKDADGSWLSKIIRIPLLMGLGIGIAINNARAVIEALVGSDSEFKRTPKFAIQNKGDIWQEKIYRGEFNYTTVIEIAMTLYFLFSLKLAIELEMYLSIPFLFLFIFGFSYVPTITLLQTAGRVFATRRNGGLQNIDIKEDRNTI